MKLSRAQSLHHAEGVCGEGANFYLIISFKAVLMDLIYFLSYRRFGNFGNVLRGLFGLYCS